MRHKTSNLDELYLIFQRVRYHCCLLIKLVQSKRKKKIVKKVARSSDVKIVKQELHICNSFPTVYKRLRLLVIYLR